MFKPSHGETGWIEFDNSNLLPVKGMAECPDGIIRQIYVNSYEQRQSKCYPAICYIKRRKNDGYAILEKKKLRFIPIGMGNVWKPLKEVISGR